MVDKQRTLPELLAPAGDMERLKMAVLYGADAVYLAGTDFGMRAFAGNFDPDELKAAVAYAHAHNVRVHCTINTMPRGNEIVRLPEHLDRNQFCCSAHRKCFSGHICICYGGYQFILGLFGFSSTARHQRVWRCVSFLKAYRQK